ncbi:MAG TPA: hypothetical protein DEF00_04280 [Candidatus Taylorbacteria bacterium]|nr:MAG: ArsR family transcriptional regulator [Parcubacteria group bacterium GW2011_GWA2_47_64]KKU97120.1 MAG: ArsR family transcriptional regulator [Parcubacteria group bacterium GW2011_GWC2_48_17]HBV01571.1 hypothetical protein [Candidatus Taylorbacteria bacterium]
MKELERILRALGNKRRLSILQFLKKNKEATVTELAEAIKLSFRSTSRHLLILSSADILERQQRSTKVYYWISPKKQATSEHVIALL